MGMVEMDKKIIKPKGWGARHTLVFLGFMALGVSYAMRFNLSLAIVAMVEDQPIIKQSNTSTTKQVVILQSCENLISKKHVDPSSEDVSLANATISKQENARKFKWTESQQGIVLGSFFYGYFITQIPGGLLAQRYSAKWVLGVGVLISAIFTIISPFAAEAGIYYFMACRFIEGLSGGTLVPSIQVILAKWLPPEERSGYVSFVFSGISIGTAITMVVTGLLIQYFGWPWVFFMIGAFSILWFVAWTYYVYDTPDQHPRISILEREFIRESIGPGTSKVRLPTPWLKMFTTLPVIIIFIAQTTKVWGLYTLLNLLPKYFKSVLHFDIRENSLTSASPQLCMFIIATVVTHTGDYLIATKRISVLTGRKLCNSIAQWGSCLALIGAALSGCDRLLALICLNFAVGFMGAGFGGCLVNVIDIAPNFAGVLMGIGNTFGSITGFLAPGVAGWILDENVTVERWRIVFFLAAGLLFTGNLLYIIFAQTDEVPWNRPPPIPGVPEDEESEEEDEVPALPAEPESPTRTHPHPHPHFPRRESHVRRESQAFIPPFNLPQKGRRYSTLSLGLSQN